MSTPFNCVTQKHIARILHEQYIIRVSNKGTKQVTKGFKMERKITITAAGYIRRNNKKVSNKKANPFYVGQDVLSSQEQDVVRKWVYKSYKMV